MLFKATVLKHLPLAPRTEIIFIAEGRHEAEAKIKDLSPDAWFILIEDVKVDANNSDNINRRRSRAM
jgi:hypothetical protein